MAAAKKPLSVEQFLKRLRGLEGPPEEILKKAKISSPLLLIGEQELRIRRLISWLVDSALGGTTISLTTYFGKELSSQASISNIISSLTNLSLFSKFEVLVLYDADKVKAAAAKRLAEAIIKSPQTLVILVSASDNKKASLLNAVSKEVTKVAVEELTGSQVKKWIHKEVKRLGAPGIEPEAVNLLEHCYGDDLSSISGELEKLLLLTEPGSAISRKIAETVSYRNPEHTSFELLAAIANGKAIHAVSLTKDLQDQGLHPLQLSAFLSRCFRTMLAHKARETVTGELGNMWFARKLTRATNSFSDTQLTNAIHLLKNLDRDLKGSPFTPELVIETAVQKLARSDALTGQRTS